MYNKRSEARRAYQLSRPCDPVALSLVSSLRRSLHMYFDSDIFDAQIDTGHPFC